MVLKKLSNATVVSMKITNEIIDWIDSNENFRYMLFNTSYSSQVYLSCGEQGCNYCILKGDALNEQCSKVDVLKFLRDNNLKPWVFL